jgi:chromatin segregation and condensation protein Rec8/ScpA/Scc1 (kleisin family)
MSEEDKEIQYEFREWTVNELRDFASANNITIPSGSRKDDIIELLEGVVSHSEFVDRTKEDLLDEELNTGEKDEDEAEKGPLFRKDKSDLKFWHKPPYSTLLNIDLAKDSDVAFYDLSQLVDKFFDKMLREDFINYKISGIALKTSASLHHHKITSVIKQEEEIQKQEKIEEMRQRTRRKIPKTLSQPVKSKMKMTSKDELYDAMRAAIIETMQKKEKLKRRRLKRNKEKEQHKEEKSNASLPKELLKHISGREQSVEELHDSWFHKIKTKIKLENKDKTSFYNLIGIINEDEESLLARKYASIRLFLTLLFLSTNNRIKLNQDDEFKDIEIFIE